MIIFCPALEIWALRLSSVELSGKALTCYIKLGKSNTLYFIWGFQ